MGKSDIDAVGARRSALERQLIELDARRTLLQDEDQELALTERVLNRLAQYFIAQPIEEPAPVAAVADPTQVISWLRRRASGAAPYASREGIGDITRRWWSEACDRWAPNRRGNEGRR